MRPTADPTAPRPAGRSARRAARSTTRRRGRGRARPPRSRRRQTAPRASATSATDGTAESQSGRATGTAPSHRTASASPAATCRAASNRQGSCSGTRRPKPLPRRLSGRPGRDRHHGPVLTDTADGEGEAARRLAELHGEALEHLDADFAEFGRIVEQDAVLGGGEPGGDLAGQRVTREMAAGVGAQLADRLRQPAVGGPRQRRRGVRADCQHLAIRSGGAAARGLRVDQALQERGLPDRGAHRQNHVGAPDGFGGRRGQGADPAQRAEFGIGPGRSGGIDGGADAPREVDTPRGSPRRRR